MIVLIMKVSLTVGLLQLPVLTKVKRILGSFHQCGRKDDITIEHHFDKTLLMHSRNRFAPYILEIIILLVSLGERKILG